MLVVEEVTLCAGDEELAAVSVFSAVGHGEKSGSVVFEGEVFIGEDSAVVDVHDAGSVGVNEVAALNHEVLKRG